MTQEKLLYEERIKNLETELQNATDTLQDYKNKYEDFILIASHDLQAPLRKLSTFTERLVCKLNEESVEQLSTYAQRITSSVNTMRSLIDSLASLSAVSEPIHLEKCDLDQLLQKVLKDIQPIIHNADISSSSLPVIEGYCSQLYHLFLNLINNSIKFQKKDTVLKINITSQKLNVEDITVFALPADKNYYKIEIWDNGIGFEDKYSKKIFEPFQRLHGKSEYDGSGLGLTICKKIIEKHHGIITAKGEKNSGAKFTIILPEKI